MGRYCAKLVTYVGTFSTPSSSSSSSYSCRNGSSSFARCWSAARSRSSGGAFTTSTKGNSKCGCDNHYCLCSSSSSSSSANQNGNNNGTKRLYGKPWLLQCSSTTGNGVGNGGMITKFTPRWSLLLPSSNTSSSASAGCLHVSTRNYSGNKDTNGTFSDNWTIGTRAQDTFSAADNNTHHNSQRDPLPSGSDNNCSIINNNKNLSISPAVLSSNPPLFPRKTQASGAAKNSSSSSNGLTSGVTSSTPSSPASPPGVPPGLMATSSSGSNFTSVRTVVTSQRLVEVTRESIMEQPKLMAKEEREEFMSVYHQLVKELLEIPDMKDMEETNRWMARVVQYNVPHGKRNRGLSTALAYKYFAPEELTEENVRLSYVLGWCAEILQAFFLVSDDIMDESETRRGRPCWYKVDNLGLAAINDALLLEATIYAIIRKHFSDKKYYAKVMEVMHDVTYKTTFGQSLDTRTGQDRRMETYTMDRYSSIVKYKTSYYSFYLPVALAMTMCEITDPNLFQQMRKVTLEMGHFFQVQDDYLDCFGDEEVTGKIGTDIQDCKCSWLFVVASQRCTPEQKKFLFDNYGKNCAEQVATVKKLYKELDMEQVYHNYEEQTYNMICTHIQQMSEQLPKGLFYDMLHKIYKRSS